MKRAGDDGREMPHGSDFDDGAIDAILGGNSPSDDLAALSSFVGDVRSAAGTVPIPSSALAAALASGISPQATTAPEPKWRKLKMKIQGFLAGLGVAGKLALGAGVAAAATTGAGAAGVLPGPVQHAFANAVHAVTPFEVPDGDGGGEHVAGPPPGDETTTTVSSTPSSEHHDGGDGDGAQPGDGNGEGDGNGVVVTPTTEHHEGDGTGATNPPSDGNGGSGSGDGDHHGDPPPTETPTTEHNGGNGDGDNNNPESLSLNCERGREPNHVTCNWSASSNPDHHRYLLLRVGDGQSRVVLSSEDGLSFTDTTVQPGVTYGYRVISVRSDDSVESHSPMVYVQCCGDTPPTTEPPHGGGGGGDHH
jgi:hypothetical protein